MQTLHFAKAPDGAVLLSSHVYENIKRNSYEQYLVHLQDVRPTGSQYRLLGPWTHIQVRRKSQYNSRHQKNRYRRKPCLRLLCGGAGKAAEKKFKTSDVREQRHSPKLFHCGQGSEVIVRAHELIDIGCYISFKNTYGYSGLWNLCTEHI